MRRVISAVLRILGVRSIVEAGDGAEAFDILRSSPADIILCDRCTRPVDGFGFVRMVRNAADSPNPFAAVIMLSVGYAPHLLADARAAGVHDLLGKPFSVKALYARIRAIIEYPRPFIRTPDYFGPNHRWQQTAFDGEDQRKTPPRAADTDAWGQTMSADDSLSAVLTPEEIRALLHGGDDDDPIVVPFTPEREDPGAGPAQSESDDVISEPLLIPVPAQFQLPVAYSPQGIDDDAILEAEAAIKGFRDEYLVWVQEDLSRLQSCFDRAVAAPSGDRGEPMRALFDVAYDMAGQGGFFGYPLITVIGNQLCGYISDHVIFSDAEMLALHLHIDAMRVVIAERLEGDGGRNRDVLIRGLRAILSKITKTDEGRMPTINLGPAIENRRKRLRFSTW